MFLYNFLKASLPSLKLKILRNGRTIIFIQNSYVEKSKSISKIRSIMIIIFSVPSCQLGYSSICKSSVSNDEKTAICPATNLVNIFLKGKALV